MLTSFAPSPEVRVWISVQEQVNMLFTDLLVCHECPTNSEGRDFEFLFDHLHHSALLQRCDSAAEHRTTAFGQVNEAALQVRRQSHCESLSVDHQRDGLGGIHVTGVTVVPPHFLQSAVQDGRTCDLQDICSISSSRFYNSQTIRSGNIILTGEKKHCNDITVDSGTGKKDIFSSSQTHFWLRPLKQKTNYQNIEGFYHIVMVPTDFIRCGSMTKVGVHPSGDSQVIVVKNSPGPISPAWRGRVFLRELTIILQIRYESISNYVGGSSLHSSSVTRPPERNAVAPSFQKSHNMIGTTKI